MIGVIGWTTVVKEVDKCKICSKKYLTPQVPEDMKNRIVLAMKRTWDAIAPDTFQCLADCGEPVEMKRSDVISVVCDAGHVSTFGNDQEASQAFNKMDYKEMVKLGKIAFPYSKYV